MYRLKLGDLFMFICTRVLVRIAVLRIQGIHEKPTLFRDNYSEALVDDI